MECDICMRAVGSDLPFHCPSCARSILYDLRVRKAQTLFEQEQLTSQIEELTSLKRIVTNTATVGTTKQDQGARLKWSLENKKVERARAKTRTLGIQKHNQILRDEIKSAREDIATRKAVLQKQRAQQVATNTVATDGQDKTSQRLKEEIKKVSQSWDAVNNKAVETRKFLCREAAHLCGLKQRKKVKGGLVRDQYWIAGLPVTLLKDLNAAKLNELTTSLTTLARLVILVSFYLSVRLPSEITLPQRDHSLPTIFTPANSYQGRDVHIPPTGSSSSSLSANSPVESRSRDIRQLPRPRPLSIELENPKDKLPHLAKTDPTSFSFFLEGISLLAWDVAWLCRSQGMTSGTESWEDVCNIGRNLWNLLISPPQSPTLVRVMSARDNHIDHRSGTQGPATTVSNTGTIRGPDKSLKLGHFSHDSAHSFSANVGTDPVRAWKLNKYTMIVDPLKKALLSEMSNAEWELLEQDEWYDGAGQQQITGEQVAIPTKTQNQSQNQSRNRNQKSLEGGQSRLGNTKVKADGSRNDGAEAVLEGDGGAARDLISGGTTTSEKGDGDVTAITAAPAPSSTIKVKGTSGWTKLKNREKWS